MNDTDDRCLAVWIRLVPFDRLSNAAFWKRIKRIIFDHKNQLQWLRII